MMLICGVLILETEKSSITRRGFGSIFFGFASHTTVVRFVPRAAVAVLLRIRLEVGVCEFPRLDFYKVRDDLLEVNTLGSEATFGCSRRCGDTSGRKVAVGPPNL